MVVGFGVVVGVAAGVALALAAGEAVALAAGDAVAPAAGLVIGAGLCSGVAIGLSGAGFFSANSAAVNFIAWSIGIRAMPFVLSTHP
jgi:hypothetical protein